MDESTDGPKTIKGKLQEMEQALKDYGDLLGLPKNEMVLEQIKADANRFMALSISGKRLMSAEECFEACSLLHQYAACIHREAQRQDAVANWCNEQTTKLIVENLRHQSAYAGKERWACAIAENEAACRMESFRIRAETYHRELSYLPMRIEKIAESYAQLGNAKKRVERNYA